MALFFFVCFFCYSLYLKNVIPKQAHAKSYHCGHCRVIYVAEAIKKEAVVRGSSFEREYIYCCSYGMSKIYISSTVVAVVDATYKSVNGGRCQHRFF